MASLGIKSLRTLNVQEIRTYVYYLGILGLSCVIMRIFWVLDIMFAVKKALRDQENHKTDPSNTNNDNNNDPGTSNDQNQQQELNKDAVTSITIQVSVSIRFEPQYVWLIGQILGCNDCNNNHICLVFMLSTSSSISTCSHITTTFRFVGISIEIPNII